MFRAKHLLTDRICALKLLRAEWMNEELSQRLFVEARAAGRVRHPNIVEIIDAGYSAAGPYLAMEFLPGRSLASLLRERGKLEVSDAVAITLAVLSALQAAHSAAIVHRDLKPDNIFLVAGPDGSVGGLKVLDFGIAKILDATAPLTQTGRLLGTVEYLSPEQVTGEASVDARSDVFSIGVLLFQLLTGTTPFRGPTPIVTTYRIVHAEPPALHLAGGPSDEGLAAVVARALKKAQADRFPSAASFAEALTTGWPEVDPERVLRQIRLDAPTAIRRPGAAPEEGLTQPDGPPLMESVGGSSRSPQPGSWTPLGGSHIRRSAAIVTQAGAEAAPASTDPAPSRGMASGTASQPRRIKGRVLRALKRATVMRHGTELCLRAINELNRSAGPTWLEPIRPQSLYDIRLYDAYCSALEGLVPGLKPEHWREMGQAALEAEIVADARHVLAAADLASLMTGAIEVWSSLFDGGSWHYELRGTSAVEVVLSNFHQVSVRLRSWLVGLVEQTFRAAGFASARADFAPAAGPANPLTLRITFE